MWRMFLYLHKFECSNSPSPRSLSLLCEIYSWKAFDALLSYHTRLVLLIKFFSFFVRFFDALLIGNRREIQNLFNYIYTELKYLSAASDNFDERIYGLCERKSILRVIPLMQKWIIRFLIYTVRYEYNWKSQCAEKWRRRKKKNHENWLIGAWHLLY